MSLGKSSNDSTGATYSLPSSFVQLHTRLGHQSRALAEAAGRLAEVSTGNWTVADPASDSDAAVTQATASVAHAFTQMAETVQDIAGVLSKQTKAETGLALARRLCQITQVCLFRKLFFRGNLFSCKLLVPGSWVFSRKQKLATKSVFGDSYSCVLRGFGLAT